MNVVNIMFVLDCVPNYIRTTYCDMKLNICMNKFEYIYDEFCINVLIHNMNISIYNTMFMFDLDYVIKLNTTTIHPYSCSSEASHDRTIHLLEMPNQ